MMSKMTRTLEYLSNGQHYQLNDNGWSSVCGAFIPSTTNSDGILKNTH